MDHGGMSSDGVACKVEVMTDSRLKIPPIDI